MLRRGLLAVLLLAFSASAQTHRDEITVNVVEVPVTIETLTGRQLRELTRDDFTLLVNGKPHPIDFVDVIDTRNRRASLPPPSLARRRLTVLLFDLLNSGRFSVLNAKRMAAEFVAETPADTAFAVAVLDRRGVHFMTPFTSDRARLKTTIQSLSRTAPDPLSLGAVSDGTSIVNPVFNDLFENGRAPGGFANSRSASDTGTTSELAANVAEDTERGMMRDLGKLASALAPISGLKDVIFLSDATSFGVDSTQVSLVRSSLKEMNQRYRSAGVILHAVDAEGLSAPLGVESSMGFLRPVFNVAIGTGGAMKPTMRAFQKSMGSVTYVIGFTPRADQKKHNRIGVRVRNLPFGAIVRHRTGFGESQSAENDMLFLADTLINDIPLSGLTVEVRASANGEVATAIAGNELIALASHKPLLLDIFFYIFDGEKNVADWHYARVAVDAEKGREFLSSNPFTVGKQFDLPAGQYAAKTLIRIVGTDIRGFARADLTVAK